MAGENMIVGLDIGTSKVTVVIAEARPGEPLEIIGVGTAPSSGLRRGVVINIEATLRSVVDAIESAEQMAGREVKRVVSGIAGSHISGLNSSGVVAVTGRGREITSADIARVIENARAVSIPMDREILHVIPRNYVIDEQGGIKDPLDMIGVRLEVEVHLITGSVTAAQNLVKCVNRAGFEIAQVVFNSIAAAEAVLSQDEKDLGVLLIDIGGGTTNVMVYQDGAPFSSFVLPMGGSQVTGDLSIMLRTSMESAEKIKREDGCAYMALVEEGEPVLVPGVGGRAPIQCTREQICEIVQPRMGEIFRLVRERLDRQRMLDRVAGGLVLTGGGALLPGVVELAQDVFDLGGRIGQPSRHGGLADRYQSPEFSTAAGLVLHAWQSGSGDVPGGTERRKAGLKRVTRWMKHFF
ncbi:MULTISPECIES: cell division protein FtsA [Alkalispirochaeta]|nr:MULTISPECIES: cell division protein FtsA [Alkalispirochaeta]